ncbi:receptor expression-enhancing protein 5, partial [Trichinella spiralis]
TFCVNCIEFVFPISNTSCFAFDNPVLDSLQTTMLDHLNSFINQYLNI